MKDKRKDVILEEEAKDLPKKPYTTPNLTVHGTVENITQALGPGNKDGLSGSAIL